MKPTQKQTNKQTQSILCSEIFRQHNYQMYLIFLNDSRVKTIHVHSVVSKITRTFQHYHPGTSVSIAIEYPRRRFIFSRVFKSDKLKWVFQRGNLGNFFKCFKEHLFRP